MAKHRQNYTDGDNVGARFPFATGGGAFDPKSLVGTQGGFWRADLGVTGSPNVTAWADQSALANNLAVLSTPVAQTSPTYSATGFNTSFPGVTVGSTKGVGVASPLINSTTMSVFYLFSCGSSQGRLIWCDIGGSDASTPGWTYYFDNTASSALYSNGNQGNGAASLNFTQNIPQVLGGIFDGAHCNVYLDFAVQGAGTAFTATLGGASGAFGIGDSIGGSSPSATLAWVLLTNTALVAGDLTNLKTWTNTNWGTSF